MCVLVHVSGCIYTDIDMEDTVPIAISTHIYLLCGRFFRSLYGLKSHQRVHSLLNAREWNQKKKKREMILRKLTANIDIYTNTYTYTL